MNLVSVGMPNSCYISLACIVLLYKRFGLGHCRLRFRLGSAHHSLPRPTDVHPGSYNAVPKIEDVLTRPTRPTKILSDIR